MNTKAAQEFLTRCFRPNETIALLLRRKNPPSTTQRIVRFEQAIAARYLAWLTYENHQGANIYVAANPLRSGSRKRIKDSIAEVRHLYLDIDADGDNRVSALRSSGAVPLPNIIISTSPDKYQVLWRVEGYDFDEQEFTLKLLAMTFGGDPACTDRNRVLRLPGFDNRKYDPAFPVTSEYPSSSISHLADFTFGDITAKAIASRVRSAPQSTSGKRTHSEMDWAWVLQRLMLGANAVALTSELAKLRSDKPNPTYYAQRTVDLATARIALAEGAAIETVIAMLIERRSHKVSAILCSSRAREIAITAQRMIAPHKFVSIHLTKENHNATA